MDDTWKAGRIFSMAEIPLQTFERSGSLEEGNIDFVGKPNGDIQQYAQHASIGNRLNIVPDFTVLRRIDIHFSVMNLIALSQEFIENGTLFGVPVTPYHKGYNEAKARKVQGKFSATMDKYRAKVIADHTFEALEEPFRWDLNTLIGDRGIIVRNFNVSTKEMFQKLGRFVSVSPMPDNAERLCLHLVQQMEMIYDKYIARVIGKRKRLTTHSRTYGRATAIRARHLTGVLISLPVFTPILALALIRSPHGRIVVTILATCLNFQFYYFMFRLPFHSLSALCASLTALYVVFISNNQIILPVQVDA